MPAVSPDCAEASRFLRLLDPSTDQHIFQTIDDNPAMKSAARVRQIVGTLSECWPALCAASANGSGIFVAVNAMADRKRRLASVERVRYAFADFDAVALPDVIARIQGLGIAPHMVIQTRATDHFHVYWKLEAGVGSEFAPLQAALVTSIHADPNAKDLTRVLRLPGFPHQKDPSNPFLVRILAAYDRPPLSPASLAARLTAFRPVSLPQLGPKPAPAQQPPQAIPAHLAAAPAEPPLPTPVIPDWSADCEAIIRSMLSAIDATERSRWISIGLILRRLPPSWHAQHRAFEIFDWWSATAPLAYGAPGRDGTTGREAVWREWCKLDDSPHPRPIGLGTLRKLAQEAGWRPAALASPPTVEALPLVTSHPSVIDEYNKKYAWIGKYQKIWSIEKQCFFSSTRGFLEHTAADVVPSTSKVPGAPPIPAAKIWLTSPARRAYHDLTFEPGKGPEVGDCLNIWSGWPVAAAPGSVQPFLDLLEQLLPGRRDEQRWLMQWMAYPVRHPGAKLNTAVMVWSATQGTGKSLLGELLLELYGEHGYSFGEAEMHESFNGWMCARQLLVGEEIGIADRRNTAAHLKMLITAQTVSINEKMQPRITMPNKFNVFLTSNDPAPLHIEEHDRRWFVAHVAETRLPHAEGRRIRAWYDAGGRAALLHHLQHVVDLSDFDAKARAPATLDKEEVKRHGRTALENGLADLIARVAVSLEEATPPHRPHVKTLWSYDEIVAELNRGSPISSLPNKTAIGRYLARRVIPKQEMLQPRPDMRRQTWYALGDRDTFAPLPAAYWLEQIERQAVKPPPAVLVGGNTRKGTP